MKPEEQIKEILDKNILVETEHRYEIDAFMARSCKLLKKSFVLYVKQHLPKTEFTRAKEIGCHVFSTISMEDFE